MPKPTPRAGHKLFVKMMEELQQHDDIREDAKWREEDGAIIRRYLAKVAMMGPAADQGFFAALTDCLSHYHYGSAPYSKWWKEGDRG